MLKDLLNLLPLGTRETILVEQLNNLSYDSQLRIIQQLGCFSINAPDAATALELVVKLRQLHSGIAMMKIEINNYLLTLDEERPDLELFLRASLQLLNKPLTLRKIKLLAWQIYGQLTFDSKVASLLNPTFLEEYWQFRENPPQKLLNLCLEILKY